MTTKDPATGLPALPEGQWWEVIRSASTGMGGYIFLGEERHYVVIRERRDVTTPRRPGKHWWDAPTPATTETKEVAVESAYIHGDLTPRGIRKAAYGLIESLNRKARADALLGAYPPKTLENK